MANENVSGEAKSGSGMMIVVILLVVILLVIIGVGYYLISSGVLGEKSQSSSDSKVIEKEVAGDAKILYQVEIKDLVLNIMNSKGREKLMKLSFALKSSEPTIAIIVEENKAEITDVVIKQISSKRSEELLTVGGKLILKEELKAEINAVVNTATATNQDIQKDNVKKLFFTAFVIK